MAEPPAWRYQKIIKPMFDLQPEQLILRGRVLTCVGDEVIEDGFVEIEGGKIVAVGRGRRPGRPRGPGGQHRRHDPARV